MLPGKDQKRFDWSFSLLTGQTPGSQHRLICVVPDPCRVIQPPPLPWAWKCPHLMRSLNKAPARSLYISACLSCYLNVKDPDPCVPQSPDGQPLTLFSSIPDPGYIETLGWPGLWNQSSPLCLLSTLSIHSTSNLTPLPSYGLCFGPSQKEHKKGQISEMLKMFYLFYLIREKTRVGVYGGSWFFTYQETP